MPLHYKRVTKPKGFTLIELLIVIVIIGLLSSAATSSYVISQIRSRDSARKAQVNNIATAVESYYAVNKKFPGKTPGSPAPNATYLNCEQRDTTSPGYFYYYYTPLQATDTSSTNTSTRTCDSRAASTTPFVYDPNEFKPFPTWIPGLGNYLNPAASEKKYQDRFGNTKVEGPVTTLTYQEILAAQDGDTSTNKTRTFVYRKLNNGYAVITRLESAGGDRDTYDGTTTPITLSDAPALPVNITGKHIYMVRK